MKKEKNKWILYFIISDIVMYALIVLILHLLGMMIFANYFILAAIVIVAFMINYTRMNKIFKGLEEYKNKNYLYVLEHKKEMMTMTPYSFGKAGKLAVAISAFQCSQDDIFLENILKIKFIDKDVYYKVTQKYYLFLYSFVTDKKDFETLYKEIMAVSSDSLETMQKRTELIYKYNAKTITEEEKQTLIEIIDSERVKSLII
ncbi:MAG: hypothetical protein J6C23_03450 [Clostridia bacterium]|nr:hypothetical protein [Clostridia bacterium]